MSEYQDVFNPYFLSGLSCNKPEKSPCAKDAPICTATSGMPSKFPEETAVTMAYIPFQQDIEQFPIDVALQKGTLFTTLNKPFLGRPVK